MKHDTKKRNKKINNKTRKQFLFNPENPKTSFDVYIDKNPIDTINIKYTTIEDVKNTIDKLEKLYKTKQYTHKRIWQVGMIMYVRLKVLRYKKPEQFALAKKYFNFLGKRTKLEDESRYTFSFTY
jgi:lipoprotein-anchoring transpeptidase ErfK/SrfK